MAHPGSIPGYPWSIPCPNIFGSAKCSPRWPHDTKCIQKLDQNQQNATRIMSTSKPFIKCKKVYCFLPQRPLTASQEATPRAGESPPWRSPLPPPPPPGRGTVPALAGDGVHHRHPMITAAGCTGRRRRVDSASKFELPWRNSTGPLHAQHLLALL